MEIKFANKKDYEQCVEMSKCSKYTSPFGRCSLVWGWGEGKVLVAKRDGKVIGFQHFNVCKKRFYTTMYFTCVHPEYRGQRVASTILDMVIKLSCAAKKEEIRFVVYKTNEQAFEYYKGLNIFPIKDSEREWEYRISLRGGIRGVGDIVRYKGRKIVLEETGSVLLEQLENAESIYDLCNAKHFEDKQWQNYRFVTFWGTNQSGKSTFPKMLLNKSKFVEVRSPFFTLLDDNVALVGAYPAHVRSGGLDKVSDFGFMEEIIEKMWVKRDIQILVGEGLMWQGYPSILNRYRKFFELFERKIHIFHCDCSLRTVNKRLRMNRGKSLNEYAKEGCHIIGKKKGVEGTLSRISDDNIFSVHKLDTEHKSIDECFRFVKEKVGLEGFK